MSYEESDNEIFKADYVSFFTNPKENISEHRINRMQKIFDTLNTAQMIIISHERTLDSFITDIFTFKKAKKGIID